MDIILRALAAYLFIVFLMRLLGRRELSSLGPTDLVLLVVIGDLIGSGRCDGATVGSLRRSDGATVNSNCSWTF